MMERSHVRRRTELRTDIAKRLARVRGDMTSDEFDALLDDMVRVAERFAVLEREPGALGTHDGVARRDERKR